MEKESVVKRNPDIIAVNLEGEKVMMSVQSGDYFGLDPVGSHIWDFIEDRKSIVKIIASIKEHFQVEPSADLEADVRSFLQDLETQQLIIRE